MDRPSSFIVKVQLSDFFSDEVRKMLIYNEDHSVLLELDATPEMVAALNNEPKTFWLATLDDKHQLFLLGAAPWQDW